MNVLDEVLNDVVGEEDEVTTPLWGENFKIVDISSRYFGACFIQRSVKPTDADRLGGL